MGPRFGRMWLGKGRHKRCRKKEEAGNSHGDQTLAGAASKARTIKMGVVPVHPFEHDEMVAIRALSMLSFRCVAVKKWRCMLLWLELGPKSKDYLKTKVILCAS